MHQMVNVLLWPRICVYPETGLPSLRCDVNWIFLPEDKKFWLQDGVYSLWTKAILTLLNLDHFIALVKYVTNIMYVKM